ncbi:AMP-binding protein [Nocardia xishanensis]|uniref:AMP-binding protein n=1 Tax=Nocardia xishanensis TaxID=238964 RepID=A0ABW7XCG5_9NOCA
MSAPLPEAYLRDEDMGLHLREGSTLAHFQRAGEEKTLERRAIVAGDQAVTGRELRLQVNRYARLFKSHGLGRGSGLSILAVNRPEVVFASYAAELLGIRYTPLHPMNALTDHVFVLTDGEIDTLIVDEAYGELGRELAARCSGLKRIFTFGPADFGIDICEAANDFEPTAVGIEALPHDIARISYTGGTTGRPKGVVHRHRSLTSYLTQSLAFWEWPSEVRLLVASPISHAAGALITPTLIRGGEFHMLAGFDPESFLATVERERITCSFIVPSMLYRLLDHPTIRDFDLSSLEMVVYGASPMSPIRLRQALDIFGPVFCQLYGQTEMPNMITYLSKAEHDPCRPHLLGSAGRPVPGNDVRLLDENNHEVPPGANGEVCVRSPLVMDGYWRRPEETEAAFSGGWLHTGDIGKFDPDGFLYIVDRAKDVIITGGFNVYPREIEDVLVEHPAVAAAVVIGAPDPKWGEAVTAVVVTRPEIAVTAEELIAFVRGRKGPLHAPKSVSIVDQIPMTAVGKPDRKAVRARYWNGTARQIG